MSRSLGNQLPDTLTSLLDGRDLPSREGLTLLLVTVGEDGWPHVAMLSAGEVLAASARELRLAMWPRSNSTANLTRTGQGTLMLVHDQASYYLRLKARRTRDLSVRDGARAFFVATLEDVLRDVVGYAVITGGPAFRLKEPDKVVPGWEETVAAMRRAESDGSP